MARVHYHPLRPDQVAELKPFMDKLVAFSLQISPGSDEYWLIDAIKRGLDDLAHMTKASPLRGVADPPTAYPNDRQQRAMAEAALEVEMARADEPE